MIAPSLHLSWPGAYRIVSSQAAPIAAFSNLVASSAEFDALLQIEALTNPLARGDRVGGRGAALIMAPFVIPTVSRFSDGSYGVFYAGDELRTAGAERAHHLAKALRESHESDIVIRSEGYAYTIGIDSDVHDVRRSADPPPPQGTYNKNNYATAQRHGRSLREAGANGLLYESVRRPGFECVAIFRPQCISDPRPVGPVYFDWDGNEITFVTQG